MSYPKGTLLTPLPDHLQDWEVIDVSRHDNDLGCTNNVPLGNEKVVVREEAKDYCESLDEHGFGAIPVPYYSCFNIVRSGIHC